MPVANPYAGKKKGSSQPPPVKSSVPHAASGNITGNARVDGPSSIKAAAKENAPVVPKGKNSKASGSVASATSDQAPGDSKPVVVKAQPPVASTNKKKRSFKSQLKREIEELKRRKMTEKQQKLEKERLRVRELEKQEKERQRKMLEQQRQAEKQRKQEERMQREAEKRRLREKKALERQRAAEEKERQRLEKERQKLEQYLKMVQDLERRKQEQLATQQQQYGMQWQNVPLQARQFSGGYLPMRLPNTGNYVGMPSYSNMPMPQFQPSPMVSLAVSSAGGPAGHRQVVPPPGHAPWQPLPLVQPIPRVTVHSANSPPTGPTMGDTTYSQVIATTGEPSEQHALPLELKATPSPAPSCTLVAATSSTLDHAHHSAGHPFGPMVAHSTAATDIPSTPALQAQKTVVANKDSREDAATPLQKLPIENKTPLVKTELPPAAASIVTPSPVAATSLPMKCSPIGAQEGKVLQFASHSGAVESPCPATTIRASPVTTNVVMTSSNVPTSTELPHETTPASKPSLSEVELQSTQAPKSTNSADRKTALVKQDVQAVSPHSMKQLPAQHSLSMGPGSYNPMPTQMNYPVPYASQLPIFHAMQPPQHFNTIPDPIATQPQSLSSCQPWFRGPVHAPSGPYVSLPFYPFQNRIGTGFGHLPPISNSNIPYPSLFPSTVAPRKKRTPAVKPMVLHKEPMSPPSPYASSHVLLTKEIIISKSRGGSFGVTVKYETQSALVEPPPLAVSNSALKVTQKPSDMLGPSQSSAESSGNREATTEASPIMPTQQAELPAQTTGGVMDPNRSDVLEKTDKKRDVSEAVFPTDRKIVHQDPTKARTWTDSSSTLSALPVQGDNSVGPKPLAPTTNVENPVDPPKKQRRRRRRRVFFGAMAVVDATKQYSSNNVADEEMKLRSGDIILEINGHKTCGLPFSQACALFANCNKAKSAQDAIAKEYESASKIHSADFPTLETDQIYCSLVVARPKPKPISLGKDVMPKLEETALASKSIQSKPQSIPSLIPIPLPTIPLVVSETSNEVVAGEFSNLEMLALVKSMLQGFGHPNRVLGYETPRDVFAQCVQKSTLTRRDLPTVLKKWFHATSKLDKKMRDTAVKHWRDQWGRESKYNQHGGGVFEYLSDAQRSTMRAAPRPARGCKCGSTDHEYVHDPKCVLYRNLRGKAKSTALSPTRKKNIDLKNLNTVEKAYKDRILKLRNEQEMESEEARFVEQMEDFQVKKCNVAVFAPTLTAMVLSAVADLNESEMEDEEEEIKDSAQGYLAEENAQAWPDHDEENSSDDEDDDLPLVALGKRNELHSPALPASKKPKEDVAGKSVLDKSLEGDGCFNLNFLAKLLKHISCTWGHVFHEPSHLDYAWRWEVYRGQTGNGISNTEAHSKNPRVPGSLSFENIRFAPANKSFSKSCNLGSPPRYPRSSQIVLSSKMDEVVNSNGPVSEATGVSDQSPKEISTETDEMVLITHLVSPTVSGLYDELMALVRSGVLRINKHGVAVLTDEWYSHVDLLLLTDMNLQWAKEVDSGNKYCINENIRATLGKYWKRVKSGWVFAQDLNDVIHDEDEYSEWRRSFQDVHQAQADDEEGIGKFGF